MSFVTFGEIMLRLTPAAHGGKINSSKDFKVDYAGSESNVASSLGKLGNNVSFVTKLPVNQLGDAAVSSLAFYGIDTQYILRGEDKIGTYFIEIGTSIRPSSVIYDRKNTAISNIQANEFDWETILRGKKWIFLSGITPVLSEQCALEVIKVAKTAKATGVKVAFDMNYRRTLWKDAASARAIFNEILSYTDLLFGNIGVLKDVYDFEIPEGDLLAKTIATAKKASKQFKIPEVAFTIRDHISASNNSVSAVYLKADTSYVSTNYNIDITDRFGTGDAFAAACLHGLGKDWEPQKTIDFATAAFALKHTIQGDQHTSTEKEIFSVMEGNIGGHVIR